MRYLVEKKVKIIEKVNRKARKKKYLVILVSNINFVYLVLNRSNHHLIIGASKVNHFPFFLN